VYAASQAFDVLQGKYDVGQATFVELSNAQIVLLQAEVSKAQADISLALEKTIIDYYIGK
jgi:outer membrane protein TolC